MCINLQQFSSCSQEVWCFPFELLFTGFVFLWWRLSGVVRLTTGEDESSSLPLLRGAMGARLSRETGCGGLVAIVLKHDSAFNSYCSRSSHLALVGERSASGGGEVDSAFTSAPVLRDIYAACTTWNEYPRLVTSPRSPLSLISTSFLQAVVISSQTTNFSRAHIAHQKIWCQLNFPPSQSLSSRSLIWEGGVGGVIAAYLTLDGGKRAGLVRVLMVSSDGVRAPSSANGRPLTSLLALHSRATARTQSCVYI